MCHRNTQKLCANCKGHRLLRVEGTIYLQVNITFRPLHMHIREGGQGYLVTMTHFGMAKSASIAVASGQSLPFWQCSKPSFARLDNAGNFFGSNCTCRKLICSFFFPQQSDKIGLQRSVKSIIQTLRDCSATTNARTWLELMTCWSLSKKGIDTSFDDSICHFVF